MEAITRKKSGISILNRTDWETRELFSFDDPFANADTIRTELSEEFKSRDLSVIDNLLRDSGVTYGVLGRTTDHDSFF